MKISFKKITIGLIAAGAVLFGLHQGVFATSSDKVTICHATSSTTNPYEQKSPDKSSDVSGHDGHNGGVYFAGMSSWGDIIPPFTYYYCTDSGYHLDGTICKKGGNPDKPATVGTYPGKNWDQEGQAVYNNSCKIPAVDCDGDYDNNGDEDDAQCSITPTPTSVVDNCTDPNADPDDCTVTPTPTATPTPTVVQTNNGGGTSDGGDGLGCATHDCSGNQVGGGSSSGSVLGASTGPTQAVLGASTFAGTGTFDTTVMNFMLTLGTILFGAGTLSYAKEKKS